MKFSQNELVGTALIGFDMIGGPFLKFSKNITQSRMKINLDEWATNFYLAFRGGNAGKKPRAILYDDFYIVAYPRGLELCCLFMKPHGIEQNMRELNKIANRFITEVETQEEEDIADNEGDDIEEIKRILVNLIKGNDMSTPELRRYFQLSNSQIWKIMNDLESSGKIKRTKKEGRAIFWTG